MEALHLRGRVLPDGEERDITIVDGRITFEHVAGAETISTGGWITPGLVDAHAHLCMGTDFVGSDRATVRDTAKKQLDAGVLAIREPGSANNLSKSIGPHEGLPRMFTAGRFLAPPGRYFPGLAREVEPADLPLACAEEAVESGSWVKLIGDFFGPDGSITPNWDAATMKAAADAAHGHGARITAHVTSPDAIRLAVDAGFDALEHASGATADLIPELVERGIAIVPTLMVAADVMMMVKSGAEPGPARVIAGWLEGGPAFVAAAFEAGVQVFAGTDAGMGPHGHVEREVRCLLAAGVDPHKAVGAASWDARTWLGLPNIEQDAPADLVVFEKDPRDDFGQLMRPGLTILDGRIIARR